MLHPSDRAPGLFLGDGVELQQRGDFGVSAMRIPAEMDGAVAVGPGRHEGDEERQRLFEHDLCRLAGSQQRIERDANRRAGCEKIVGQGLDIGDRDGAFGALPAQPVDERR